MVVNFYRTYAYRSTRIEQVARLQRKELGDVAHQLVNLVEHIARTAFLHRLSVDVQMEVQRLDVEELLFGNPLANDRRAIETLADFPRQALGSGLTLQVAGGEVDANGYCIVVAVGEALGDALTQTADANHQLRLVVHLFRPVGDEEGLMVLQALVKMTGFSGLYNAPSSSLLCWI